MSIQELNLSARIAVGQLLSEICERQEEKRRRKSAEPIKSTSEHGTFACLSDFKADCENMSEGTSELVIYVSLLTTYYSYENSI